MAENIFEKVLENVDIVDVVSRFVELIPKGKNLFGICPFHDDSNPSMSVSRERGIFHCFTCKEGGNAIKFIEKYKHMSSIEAARWLAQEYHIDVSEYGNPELDKTKRYYDMLGTTQKFFTFIMNNDEYSKEAREYLKNRGISYDTIKEFGIGLSPSDSNALTDTLVSKGYILPDIILNGLSTGENDTFIDRITIPIRDEQGRTVAFGGRIYKKGDNSQNKYTNSKETPIFEKGKTVFNLDRASRQMKGVNYLILNEGYMDVIQAYSKGIKNSIAIMGTQMTTDQANLIKKYTKNVIICLDGDRPGIESVKSVATRLEEVGINYSITILENGMDPDEYIRKNGINAYMDALTKKRLDKIGYLYELTKLDYPEINTFNMESFKNSIFDKMKNEKSKSVIETYLKRLALDLKVSIESISQDFETFSKSKSKNYRNNQNIIKNQNEGFKVTSAYEKAEHMIIDYALESKPYFDQIENIMESRVFLKDANYRMLFIEIGDIYDSKPKITSFDLINALKERGAYGDFVHDENIQFSFDDLINRIIKTLKREELKELIEIKKAQLISLSSNLKSDEAIKLQKELSDLKKECRK